MELVYYERGWMERYDQEQIFIRIKPFFFNYGESGFVLLRGNRLVMGKEVVWR